MEYLYKQTSENTQLHLLLSRISHELRNPVALLSSQLQMMEEHHSELCENTEWENLQENLDYLIALLQELSDFNNADLLHLERMNLYDFLLPVLHSIKPTLDYLNISLQLHLEDSLPSFLLDRVKLRQAILNLVRNAQEAITPPGAIYVEAFVKNQNFYFSIKDTGPGIPNEYLPTLFEPFVTHKPNGTGLGLAIVRQIVEAHHGNIQVESIEGKGSTFTLIFPLSSTSVSSPESFSDKPEPQS